MKFVHILVVFLVACQHEHLLAVSLDAVWTRSYDSLADYELLKSGYAASVMQCLVNSMATAVPQLVVYNASTSECRAFKCSLMLSDCRKCRNVKSTKQQVWIPMASAAKCWVTLQHRVSNSVDFYRTWVDYTQPFGEGADGNFWIGLEAMHNYTATLGGRRLRFLMKSWNGSAVWAQYSNFSVGPSLQQYQVSVSGFSSSQPGIGDSFGPMSGSKFSTWDQDNDGVPTHNVALEYHGAWWFNGLSRCHPNGQYTGLPTALNTPYGQGLIWLDNYGCCYSLMEIEMLIA